MAKQNKGDNILTSIFIFLIGLICIVAYNLIIKFFEEINTRGLWKECLSTLLFLVLANLIPISLVNSGMVASDAIWMSALMTFLVFCIYWWYRFKA